jgi:hypothetical protein
MTSSIIEVYYYNFFLLFFLNFQHVPTLFAYFGIVVRHVIISMINTS